MENVLDSPAWHALNTRNRGLSFGNDKARYFDRAVSPFAAIQEISDENFQILFNAVDHESTILFMTPVETDIPSCWKKLHLVKGIQMVWDTSATMGEVTMSLKPLTYEHVPQMVELTKLT
ncbi:MAG: hypothetical protein JSU01_12370, partial [Bacteroidetes bacterium]|nr:hypothetical protein [Bacteroidota bacterium]